MALKSLLSVNCYLKDFSDKSSKNPEAEHRFITLKGFRKMFLAKTVPDLLNTVFSLGGK